MSMYDLPDAPWIQDAELNGVGYEESVYCPVCGQEDPEELYIDKNTSEVVGCSDCLKSVDAWDWIQDHKPFSPFD